MRDPYDILGVPRDASAAAIKGAFRRLAKKLHPDANKHDPKAAARFAELNAAYEIVGDEKKRKAFDRGEIDAEGKPRGFEGFGARPGAAASGAKGTSRPSPGVPAACSAGRPRLLPRFRRFRRHHQGHVRGGGRGRAGAARRSRARTFASSDRDVSAAVTITLPEAAKGTTRRVHLPNGKELEVKIPGRTCRRQADPAQGSRPARARRAPAMS